MMFNTTTQKVSLFFALCLFVLAVTACTPAQKKTDSYVGSSGAVTVNVLKSDGPSARLSVTRKFPNQRR